MTYIEHGMRKLTRLCEALGFPSDETALAVQLFSLFASPWGDRAIADRSAFHSEVSDDHTPFEFSAAFGGAEPEVRILIEPQGASQGLGAQQHAALALLDRLVAQCGVSRARFDQIKDLFCPADPKGLFSIWFAVCLWPHRAPAFKLYLNPQARGRELAELTIKEAMHRLGYGEAWAGLSEIAGGRGFTRDELTYFSLDLTPQNGDRAKVYFRHLDISIDELERAFSLSPSHQRGDVRTFLRTVAAEQIRYSAKPMGSCFAYTEHDRVNPCTVTLHFPISHYVSHDREATSGISRYFEHHGLPAALLERAIGRFAGRSLGEGSGMQSYASLRRDKGRPRVTVYLSPESYGSKPPRAHVPAPPYFAEADVAKAQPKVGVSQ